MEKICKTCGNRCSLVQCATRRKVAEVCYITVDAGREVDPINLSSDGTCEYYESVGKYKKL